MIEIVNRHLALARRYRPQTFKELIGQDALRQTLQNSISYNRIAQAYMLSGVRGVGKTTTARIIAKILNCTNLHESNNEPCLTCDNCQAITNNSFMDITELDAASHTGVDDIRHIIDQAHYHPSQGLYRIFILDEVHMLSKSAFNALLKTLEEPPAHVIFIFATTEIRKVPPTILSRCQRFDLKRVNVRTLMNHFIAIASQENYELSHDAAYILARASDGSVRDGLSMLDQAISLAYDNVIEPAHINAMLGQADMMQLWDLFGHIIHGRQDGTLQLFHQLINAGAEPRYLIEQLADITHHITIAKIEQHPNKNDVTIIPDSWHDIIQQLSMSNLARIWQFLSKAYHDISLAHDPIMSAEMALIRLLLLGDYPPPEEFFKQHMQTAAPDDNSQGNATASTQKKTL